MVGAFVSTIADDHQHASHKSWSCRAGRHLAEQGVAPGQQHCPAHTLCGCATRSSHQDGLVQGPACLCWGACQAIQKPRSSRGEDFPQMLDGWSNSCQTCRVSSMFTCTSLPQQVLEEFPKRLSPCTEVESQLTRLYQLAWTAWASAARPSSVIAYNAVLAPLPGLLES